MPSIDTLREPGLALWRRLEDAADSATTSALNPLRHLGAIGFLCFWLLAISGIYLYAVLDTSATGAYPSIEQLVRQPWYFGGWLRSLHRYAADAFVVVMFAHLLREWLHGRYTGFRRFSWLTGVPLIGFVFVCAIGGFWLNWDQLGQFSAIATAEWLDEIPGLAAPLARNFLTADAVNDRLFSLFIFVHLGVPLLLVFGLWFHIQRISLAAVFPPRPVAWGVGLTLLLMALVWPVTQQPPADVAAVPITLSYDWILLFLHPLTYATSPGLVWGLVAGSFLLLMAMPFLPARAAVAPIPVAIVDPANCNGCRRCFADCPYAAITMVPHPNQKVGKELALVNADLCASCGICAGACPSSTPFRSATELVTGIDMPQQSVQSMRTRLRQGLDASRVGQPIVIFGCDHGAKVEPLAADDVVPMSMICIGMLPPSFVDYALRDGAAGVVISGCGEGGCEFRLGQQWTEERLRGEREPHLRTSVPTDRWATVWAGAADQGALLTTLDQMRERLKARANEQETKVIHD